MGGESTRWLDLRSLCNSYLPHIHPLARLTAIHYFSALAHHLEASKPGVTARHETYVRCLEATGVSVELSKFKRKEFICPRCGRRVVRYEEKETDVAISVRLLDLFCQDACDVAVMVTGDSDIVPSVRCARRLYAAKKVFACFPYFRQSLELKSVSNGAFQITKEAYRRHQFPEPFRTPGGVEIPKPRNW